MGPGTAVEMISILYISDARIEAGDRDRILEDIRTASIARNSMLDITGVLIAAPHHFAQLIEGPILSVSTVMASITADPRHTGLRVIRNSTTLGRSSVTWRMARFDSEAIGATCVTPLMIAAQAGDDADAIDRLDRLITESAGGTAFWRRRLQPSLIQRFMPGPAQP
jgi:hypothetical protein